MTATRRRGFLLLSLALASGGLAASQVRARERGVEARVGRLVPVVVAARAVPAGQRIAEGDLALKRVPARFAPPDAVGDPGELAGGRTVVPVDAGAYLSPGLLEGAGGRAARGPLRAGERALEVGVDGVDALAGAGPGARVDVLVSTRRHEGAGRSFLALEGVELLDLRQGGGDEVGAGQPGDRRQAAARATLRVTLRQAVYLTAADNFGEEVRLLARPPGDRRRAGPSAVGEGEL
jgi:pilus assembly protein CpaB